MRPMPRYFRENRFAPLVEVVAVFLVAVLVTGVGWMIAGEGALARQTVVWVANVAMLLMIGIGLRLRGQSWRDLGLGVGWPGWRRAAGVVLKSILVFVAAIAAFVLAGLWVPQAAGNSGQADLSSYDWLHGNLPMLLFALAVIYPVSSFGEEVVYRGFLNQRLSEFGGGSRWADVCAVTGSAVIFGLAHFSWGPVGILQTTAMGMALGIAWLLLNRQLWVLVLAHCYLDTMLLVPLYLGPSSPA